MSKSRFPGGLITSAPVAPTNTSANGVFDGREQFQYSATSSGIAQWPGEDYEISRSLRFRGSASAYLSKTFGTATNNKIWTFSAWVKRSDLAASGNTPLMNIAVNGQSYQDISFNSGNSFRMYHVISNVDQFYITTSAVFRDMSAWYHIVATYDSTQAMSSNRLALYVNGVKQICGTPSYPSLNLVGYFNTAVSHDIGRNSGGPYYLDGYLTEVNFIDGQQLDPSYFGYTDQSTNIWMPKAYSGTYGNNGFYLPFNDPTSTTTIGYDRQLGLSDSSKNNWTATNISITAGVTYDSMVDVPVNVFTTATDVGGVVRGNYATLSPVNWYSSGAGINYDGSLRWYCSGNPANQQTIAASIASNQKFYCEFYLSVRGAGTALGIISSDHTLIAQGSVQGNYYATAWTFNPTNGTLYNNSASSGVWSAIPTATQMCLAVDPQNNKWWFGTIAAGVTTWYTSTGATGGNPVAGTGSVSTLTANKSYIPYCEVGVSGEEWIANFGQRPYAGTPPAGYNSLNTTNLQAQGITSVGLAGLQPNKHFEATVYTGIDKKQSINNAGGFQPDFIWTKSCTNAYAHNLIDSVRGRQGILQTQSSAVELTSPALNDLVSFDSNGFTIGPSNQASTTGNGGKTIAWQWKGGGASVSNTSGTITSSVSANVNAGFSVVSFNSTSASGTTATVGHGLGAVPSMIMMKNRGQLYNWEIYHISSTSTSGRLIFTSSAKLTDANPWNQTTQAVTSSIFGYNQTWNGAANDNIIAYCFAPIAGYSAFGSYTGNGSADGTFVYLGFRPRWVLLKKTSAVGHWFIYDAARDTYNLAFKYLLASDSGAENTTGTANVWDIDILSNGFKIRNDGGFDNASSATYIYAAFAETPFALNNRAR